MRVLLLLLLLKLLLLLLKLLKLLKLLLGEERKRPPPASHKSHAKWSTRCLPVGVGCQNGRHRFGRVSEYSFIQMSSVHLTFAAAAVDFSLNTVVLFDKRQSRVWPSFAEFPFRVLLGLSEFY